MAMSTKQLQPPPDPVAILCDNKRRAVFSLVFGPVASPFENKLFSGHEEGWVVQWALERSRPDHSWKGHPDTVLWIGVEIIQDCIFLFTQGREGVVQVWKYQDREWISHVDVQCASMLYCNSSLTLQEHKLILAVPNDIQSSVKMYGLQANSDSKLTITDNYSLEPNCAKQYGMCMKMHLFPNQTGIFLVVGYENGSVGFWDITSRSLLSELNMFEDPIMCLTAWTVTSNNIVSVKGCCGSTSNKLKLFSIQDSKVTLLKSMEVTNAGFSDACIRNDAKIIVTGGWDYAGRMFSAKTFKPLGVLTYHQKGIGSVTFAHDNTLAIGCRSGYISLWNVYRT